MPYMDNHAFRLLMERELGELDPDKSPELVAALQGRPLLECFVQPGGRDPKAENIHNLPGATPENPEGGRGYYALQVAANKHRPGYVDRMVDNKPVPMTFGQQVNPGFNYADHVRDRIEYDPRRKLIIGMDQGLFAAAVAQQRTPMGEIRTLRECVFMREDGKALEKIGPTAFGKAVKAMLADNFADVRPDWIRVVCDPAAFNAGEREDNEIDWIRAVEKALGLKIHKAKSNSPQLRNGAVWQAMDARNGYAVDRSCRHLIKGHLGGYHYRKAELAGGTGEMRGHLEIADTIFTHVCDAEQYAALEGEHVISELRGKSGRRGPDRHQRQQLQRAWRSEDDEGCGMLFSPLLKMVVGGLFKKPKPGEPARPIDARRRAGQCRQTARAGEPPRRRRRHPDRGSRRACRRRLQGQSRKLTLIRRKELPCRPMPN
jgi:hypothetical protein